MKKALFFLFLICLFSCSDSDDEIKADINKIENTLWFVHTQFGVYESPYRAIEFINSTDFVLVKIRPNGIIDNYILAGTYTQEEGRVHCLCYLNNDKELFPSDSFTLAIDYRNSTMTVSIDSERYLSFIKQLHFPIQE